MPGRTSRKLWPSTITQRAWPSGLFAGCFHFLNLDALTIPPSSATPFFREHFDAYLTACLTGDLRSSASYTPGICHISPLPGIQRTRRPAHAWTLLPKLLFPLSHPPLAAASSPHPCPAIPHLLNAFYGLDLCLRRLLRQWTRKLESLRKSWSSILSGKLRVLYPSQPCLEGVDFLADELPSPS